MKFLNDVKARLAARVFCKFLKIRGLDMEAAQELIEAEWENA